TADFSAFDVALSNIVLTSDGKVVIAGSIGDGDFAVVRFTDSGALDTSFDGDGLASVSLSDISDSARAIAVAADGSITAVGYALNAGNFDLAAARFMADGSLDTSFDSDGIWTKDLGSNGEQAMSVALLANGATLLSGFSRGNGVIVKLTAGGAMDTSFANA